MLLSNVIKFIYLNFIDLFFNSLYHKNNKGAEIEQRINHFFPNHDISSLLRILQMCQSLPWQLSSEEVYLYQSILCNGFCTIDLSRELARYRNMPQSSTKQVVSSRHKQSSTQEYPSRCQRAKGLAYLCRVRTGAYKYGASYLCRRRYWSRVGRYGLRVGLHNYRSVPFAFPLGTFSKTKSRYKAAYSARYPWVYTSIHVDHRWKSARCQYPGPTVSRAWSILSDRSRIYRFCSTLHNYEIECFLYYAHKIQLSFQEVVLSSPRHSRWNTLRSDNCFGGCQDSSRISGQIEANTLLRYRTSDAPQFPHKQLFSSCNHHCSFIQMQMEGRNFLQMDQTTSSHKSFLWFIRKRCENTNMDRNFCICAPCNNQEKIRCANKSLHFFTSGKRLIIRENTHNSCIPAD